MRCSPTAKNVLCLAPRSYAVPLRLQSPTRTIRGVSAGYPCKGHFHPETARLPAASPMSGLPWPRRTFSLNLHAPGTNLRPGSTRNDPHHLRSLLISRQVRLRSGMPARPPLHQKPVSSHGTATTRQASRSTAPFTHGSRRQMPSSPTSPSLTTT